MIIRTIVILLAVLLHIQADAQVGRLLKERAKNAIRDPRLKNKMKKAFNSGLDDIRSEYDSSSFNYAIALNDNAGLFENKENFERQKKFMIEYLQRRNSDEITAEQRARGWVDRAEVMYATGRYKIATGLLIGAKAIYEEIGMENSIEYARTISNLSLVAHSLGRLNLAEKLGVTSLEMRDDLLGKESNGYAASLNNYALIKKDLGLYNEAEILLKEAVVLNRDIVGAKSMGHAIALNNLASVNQVLGRYPEAEPLYKQSINIAEEHLAEKSGNYQRLMTNLALLYQDMERYEEAEEIYLDAISLKEKRFGKSHPDYAHMLNMLASLYVEMGKDDQVEKLLKEALEIYTTRLSPKSPNTASTRSDLGNFYRYKGRYDEALPLLQSVAVVRKEVLGPKHPQTIETAEDLAIVHWKLGNTGRAAQLYKSVIVSTLQEINSYFLPMSEAEKAKYWRKVRPRFQRFYAFAIEAGQEDPEFLTAVFNLQLATKALLLNTGNKIKSQIMNGDDENLKRKYADWVDQKEALAHYYGYSKEELEEENINLDSLENEANASERYLSENSTVFKRGMQLTEIKYRDVVNILEEDEAVIEIIHTTAFENRMTNQSEYIVLVVKKGDQHPKMVAITNGDELEGRYFKFYNNAIKAKIEDPYSYDQFWKPIEPLIASRKTLYLSLDGIYNQINLGTLKDPQGGFLVSKYTMTLLSNSKDLIEYKKSSSTLSQRDIFLLGYPEYGGDGTISMLPGTKREIETVSNILKPKRFDISTVYGNEATETAVKRFSDKHIVHIATHGYFLADLSTKEGKVFGINIEKARENPLLRSGLMFTGAGQTSIGEQPPDLSGNDNGILTAYEGMNLNLDNTNLVVLSACETGLGDIVAGEGVYGLQRSLLIAGADNLIMSLWKVDDEATQKLMTYFYRNLGENGNIASSFRKAQNQLKNDYPHPYYWGGFVLISG